MSLGTSLMINSNLGVSSFDALNVGLSNRFGLTTGLWCIICGIILIFINAFLLKEKPSLTSFLTSMLAGVFIDFWLAIVNINIENKLSLLIILILGLLVSSLGIALYINADIAKGPIDNFMLAVSKAFGKSLRFAKTINELFFLLLAICVMGPIGIGTIIIALLSGLFIQFFNDMIISFKIRKEK